MRRAVEVHKKENTATKCAAFDWRRAT